MSSVRGKINLFHGKARELPRTYIEWQRFVETFTGGGNTPHLLIGCGCQFTGPASHFCGPGGRLGRADLLVEESESLLEDGELVS